MRTTSSAAPLPTPLPKFRFQTVWSFRVDDAILVAVDVDRVPYVAQLLPPQNVIRRGDLALQAVVAGKCRRNRPQRQIRQVAWVSYFAVDIVSGVVYDCIRLGPPNTASNSSVVPLA